MIKRIGWILNPILVISSLVSVGTGMACEQAPRQWLQNPSPAGPDRLDWLDGLDDRTLQRAPPRLGLPLPSVQPLPPEEECLVLLVLKGSGDEEDLIYKGATATESERMVAEDPMELEQEIAQYVEAELLRHPEIRAILIKVDGSVRMGVVERVKRGIGLSAEGMKRQLAIGVLNRMERR